MKTLSIREIRHHWPKAEALLETEGELIITRDTKPIAKLVSYHEESAHRKSFDPTEHEEWQEEVNGGMTVQHVDKYLMADRED